MHKGEVEEGTLAIIKKSKPTQTTMAEAMAVVMVKNRRCRDGEESTVEVDDNMGLTCHVINLSR